MSFPDLKQPTLIEGLLQVLTCGDVVAYSSSRALNCRPLPKFALELRRLFLFKQRCLCAHARQTTLHLLSIFFDFVDFEPYVITHYSMLGLS